MIRKNTHWLFGIIILLSVAGCAPLIAPYDQQAYQQTAQLKAESIVLMGQATQPFNQHKKAVLQLTQQIDAAAAKADKTQKNELVAKQWMVLKDSNGNLLGGFFRYWQQQKTLKTTYIKEKQAQIARAFDAILTLKVNKPK